MTAADASDIKSSAQRRAFGFVFLIGILSFFADFAYEGSRSIIGPYLATFGASAAVVGIVTGFGEFFGYGLRLLSGRAADRSGKLWPITIFGYVVQMLAVPALALSATWPVAAALIVLERAGKGTRNPPRDAMLAYAGKRLGGYGWVFGLNEALDQAGAMAGPLLVAAILASRASYRLAFAALLAPALVTLVLVGAARLRYPHPEDLEPAQAAQATGSLPRIFWIYLAGAALVAAGFADYPLIAYHFSRARTVPSQWIAIFYAIAMGMGGLGSLLFGRLFDRLGFAALIWLTLLSASFAPLVFLGNFWLALLGTAIWGVGMGVHESLIPAAVAPMVPAARRASAFGLFTAGYGLFWFLGSAAIGLAYDLSPVAAMAFCVLAELAAVPIFLWVARMKPVPPAAAA